MPPQAAPAAAPAAPAQEQGGFSLLRTIAMGFIGMQVVSYLTGPSSPILAHKAPLAPASAVVSNGPAGGDGLTPTVPLAPVKQVPVVPYWQDGQLLDVYAQLSTAEDGNVDFADASLPSVTWKGLEYDPKANWQRSWDTEWAVPPAVQHNATLWLDAFVTPAGRSPDPAQASYPGARGVLHVRKALTRFYPLRKVRATKNLLSGAKAEEDEARRKARLSAEERAAEEAVELAEFKALPIVSYYHPNLTLQIVTNAGAVAYHSFPPNLQEFVNLVDTNDTDDKGRGYYYPITYANDFWLLRDHMNPINETVTRLPLHVTLAPTSIMKFQLLQTLAGAFEAQAAQTSGGGGELDSIKRVLIDSNPWLLLSTVVVGILHMLTSTLAFASDISHTRKRKDLIGVSVRTILSNVFVELVVLLYLWDESEQTSNMILLTQGMGLAVEAWKITKAVDIKVVPAAPGSLLPYKVEFKDKHVLTEDEIKSREYDRQAFRMVGIVAAPCLVAYTVYSFLYNEHRGYYSFVLKTIVSFVHLGGFALLIPQLIINYKLKSVSHLPKKTFVYKFLGTIIDDLASFAIKQPLLHRIACFRDDVVFVVLLYQMWIYKTDYSRENEYGQKLDDDAIKQIEAEEKIRAADAAAQAEAEKKGGKAEKKKDK